MPLASDHGKTAKINGQVSTEQEQHENCQGQRNTAVMMDGIVNPVESAEIVHQPTDAAQGKGFPVGPVTQRQEQRKQRHPGKIVQPELGKPERQKNAAQYTQ